MKELLSYDFSFWPRVIGGIGNLPSSNPFASSFSRSSSQVGRDFRNLNLHWLTWYFCAATSDIFPLSVKSHCPTFGKTDISYPRKFERKDWATYAQCHSMSSKLQFFIFLRIFYELHFTFKNFFPNPTYFAHPFQLRCCLTLSTSLVAKTAKYCRLSSRHLEKKFCQKIILKNSTFIWHAKIYVSIHTWHNRTLRTWRKNLG